MRYWLKRQATLLIPTYHCHGQTDMTQKFLLLADMGPAAVAPYLLVGRACIVTRNRELKGSVDSTVYLLPISGNIPEVRFTPGYALAFLAYLITSFLMSIIAFTKCRFRLVVAYFAFPQGFVGALVSFITRRPLLICTDGGDVDVLLQNPIIRPLYGFGAARSKMMTAENTSKIATLRKCFPKRDVLLKPTSVDTRRFGFVPFDKKMKWEAVAVSRYSPEKNLGLLLESVYIMADFLREKRFRLKIAGYGPEERVLRSYIAEHSLDDLVVLTGRIQYEKIQPFYDRAAIFFLPSYREGMSISMLEAMASGCICIASDIPDNSHLIDDGQTGFLFTNGNVHDLARRLESVISGGYDLAAITRNARTRVEASFSHDNQVAFLRQSFTELVVNSQSN